LHVQCRRGGVYNNNEAVMKPKAISKKGKVRLKETKKRTSPKGTKSEQTSLPSTSNFVAASARIEE
jgi:hypothetical protein